jgi:uncharacterized membrane protein YgcG
VFVLIAALGTWCFNLALNRALTRVRPAILAQRRNLTAARAYLAEQLQRHDPRLQDAWYPYLIAFGLDKEMDRWFERYGGASSTTSPVSGTFGSGSHGSSSPSWSGGGGAFGGGGASGAWTTAATAMAAGVATASSSGGGGGGGGSSGGGGGGGW